MQYHNVDPVFDESSRILVLGSFPSVKSREDRFFYQHPQNRFWRVMAAVLSMPAPDTVEEKREMLINGSVALWDVMESCEITGSSDSSIKNVKINDIGMILDKASIRRIFTNGAAATSCYRKYCLPVYGINCVQLPSTSPANAKWTLDALIGHWSTALSDYLGAF